MRVFFDIVRGLLSNDNEIEVIKVYTCRRLILSAREKREGFEDDEANNSESDETDSQSSV